MTTDFIYDIHINMNCKKKEKRYKFVQALIHPDMHKDLRRIALEQDITLAELVEDIIASFLKRKGGEALIG